MVEVSAAIIKKDDKILICQRPKGKNCELLWEFPGGKLESLETPKDCLIRECKEELDVTIEVKRLVQKVEYDYPDTKVLIYFYLCEIKYGNPSCIEHNDIKWCTINEISNMNLCPADREMLNNSKNDI